MMRRLLIGFLFLAFLCATPALAQFRSIYHDPWLNWDFWNFAGVAANDLDIVVKNSNYNPGANWWAAPFDTMTLIKNADGDKDGILDTIVRYSFSATSPIQWINPRVMPPQPPDSAHGGLYTAGSGGVLTAYWTVDGNQVGPALAITNEVTEIRTTNSGEIHMQLSIAPGYFKDKPTGTEAGWTNIRVFRNIPADRLGLADLHSGLDLEQLHAEGFEVTPMYGQPGIPGSTQNPILLSDQNYVTGPDSFFDVYLDTVGDEFLNRDYRSLLVATVLNQGTPVGMFWNLNPQSPEPATLSLLALGGLALIRRRRK